MARCSPEYQRIGVVITLSVLCVIVIQPSIYSGCDAGGGHGGPRGAVNVASDQLSCKLSLAESSGFFCESDVQWRVRRARVIFQRRRQEISTDARGVAFFQKNWEPDFSCIGLTRVGNPGDGGKWVCDPSTQRIAGKRCIIYSIGSSNMYGFEEGMHEQMPHCEIHIFDHTVVAPKPPAFATFHALGLGPQDKGNVLTLASIQARLGHVGASIEVLKIDCDGCEYDALFDVMPAWTSVRQVLIELHWKRTGAPFFELHSFFSCTLSSMLCS